MGNDSGCIALHSSISCIAPHTLALMPTCPRHQAPQHQLGQRVLDPASRLAV